MSHFTKVEQANIVSKEAFVKAAEEMGYKIKADGMIRGWNGRTTKMDVGVSCPEQEYDFGIKKNAKGTFDLIAESFFPRKILNRASQLTTKHTIISDYHKKGFLAKVSEDAQQNLVVTLTR